MHTNSPSSEIFWSVEDALEFARAAHATVRNSDGSVGQVRKFTGEPYVEHPIEVSNLVAKSARCTKVMIAAALLHDVAEDTSVTLSDIEKRFGPEVRELVECLTNPPHTEGESRADRKAAARQRLEQAPWQAQTIKCADIRSNAQSIASHDPKFAKVWIPEKLKEIAAMSKADPELRDLARKTCLDALASIETKHDKPRG